MEQRYLRNFVEDFSERARAPEVFLYLRLYYAGLAMGAAAAAGLDKEVADLRRLVWGSGGLLAQAEVAMGGEE